MQSLELQQFERVLQKNGLSVTKARKTVFLVLLESGAPITMQELILHSNKAHYVSVYRTVDILLRVGLIKQVPIGFKNRYEVSDEFKPHHHHVTCEQCGTSTAIHDDKIEQLMHEITVNAGMKPTKHHFEAYGICATCND